MVNTRIGLYYVNNRHGNNTMPVRTGRKTCRYRDLHSWTERELNLRALTTGPLIQEHIGTRCTMHYLA